MDYSLLDSGNQQKLERFGRVTLVRPCSAALWKPRLSHTVWQRADASFSRQGSDPGWKGNIPSSWQISHGNVFFTLTPTDFGHVGLFPEHAFLWGPLKKLIEKHHKEHGVCSILNLFGYTGGATLAFAQGQGQVCHVDASHPMVKVARSHAELNSLQKAPIRWIVDDAETFLKREKKRGRRYDAILLDPPSFGRGSRGEVFKIEEDLPGLLSLCRDLLSENPLFLTCSTHTPGITPLALSNLVDEACCRHPKPYQIDRGELTVTPQEGYALPLGIFAQALFYDRQERKSL